MAGVACQERTRMYAEKLPFLSWPTWEREWVETLGKAWTVSLWVSLSIAYKDLDIFTVCVFFTVFLQHCGQVPIHSFIVFETLSWHLRPLNRTYTRKQDAFL